MDKLHKLKDAGDIAANMLSLPLRAHHFIFGRPYGTSFPRLRFPRFARDFAGGVGRPYGTSFGRSRESIKRRPIKKILVIKMWGIGNITLLLPILKKIKEQYEESYIYFLTLDSNKGLLENSPFVTKVFYIKLTTNAFKIARDAVKYAALFRKSDIDILLNFEQCNRLSAIFAYLTGAQNRLGFEIANCDYNSLYTNTVKNNPELHVSVNFANLARKAGVMIDKYEYMPPEIGLPSKENVKKIMRQFGLNGKTIIAMHVGSGENFTGKRWRSANFARLADKLIERYGATIVYTGIEKEKKLVEGALSKMKHNALNLCGRFTLEEMAEFLRHCYLFISNDTGPLHIAVSLGINTAGIYGPMNPRQYGALNNNNLSFYKPIGCNPCLTDLNNKTSLCKESKCLDKITVEEIMEKISEKFFRLKEAPVATEK